MASWLSDTKPSLEVTGQLSESWSVSLLSVQCASWKGGERETGVSLEGGGEEVLVWTDKNSWCRETQSGGVVEVVSREMFKKCFVWGWEVRRISGDRLKSPRCAAEWTMQVSSLWRSTYSTDGVKRHFSSAHWLIIKSRDWDALFAQGNDQLMRFTVTH